MAGNLEAGIGLMQPLGSKKTPKQRAVKKEKHAARRLGGKAVTNSGAGVGNKGDISRDGQDTSALKTDHFLVEHKERSANSVFIDNKFLLKISQEARAVQKYPAVLLDLQGLAGLTEHEWVCIPFSVFCLLLESQ